MPLQPKSGKEFFGFSPKVQKHATKKKKKKRAQRREREEWGRIREQMLPEKREREREFCFFFFLGALSQYLPILNDEGTAA